MTDDEPTTARLFAAFIAAQLGDDPPEAARADEPPPPINFKAPEHQSPADLEQAMRDYQKENHS